LIALDTNVVVRIVTGDDPDQVAAALRVLRSERLWLSKTVLLETEWVLRYSYRLGRATIAEALGKALGYRKMEVEDRGAVLRALDWYLRGMDFADALHLASSLPAETFLTFDQGLATSAERLEASPAVELLGT
jgi:predicted nucleic-acid-binding protein